MIFIDFDDVIFNTKKFKEDFRNIFIAEGIPGEIFDDCYVDPHDTRAIKTFNPWHQLDMICLKPNYINIDKIKINSAVKKFIKDISVYIFDDVIEFVEKYGKENVCIVSFGEKEFQSEKIKNSGITKHVPNVFVTQSLKSSVISEIISRMKNDQQEKSFFIDDRSDQIEDVKKSLPGVHTFLMCRKEGRYCDSKNEFCDYSVSNLYEVQRIISKNIF